MIEVGDTYYHKRLKTPVKVLRYSDGVIASYQILKKDLTPKTTKITNTLSNDLGIGNVKYLENYNNTNQLNLF